ncbi:MAG: hypothetical protein KTR25_09425 [Myxococcales bacterium]|nr:hypothetical protein [Myxococcales bacterium]
MGWVIREVSFPWNALDEEGAYRAYATDERQSRSRRSTEKGPAKRLTHFSDGLLVLTWHCEQWIPRHLRRPPIPVMLGIRRLKDIQIPSNN